MLDKQIDSVITDSIVPVSDSVVFPASLLRETVSWKPFLPFDTLTNQVELVDGIPLSGEKMNIEFISSILIYTVVYLVLSLCCACEEEVFSQRCTPIFSTGKEELACNRKAGCQTISSFSCRFAFPSRSCPC